MSRLARFAASSRMFSGALLASSALLATAGSALAEGCPGNLLANPGFVHGLVPGSMPGASVDDWLAASASPQVVGGPGCEDTGLIQMWGNDVVGESVQQILAPPGIVAGRTYRLTLCMRWLDNNPSLPQFVQFRVRASNGAISYGVNGANSSDIGITATTSSTAWQMVTLPEWTAPFNCDRITINPQNGFTVNDGAFVSWGQIDNLCLVETKCKNGLLVNGAFTDGLVAGNLGSPGAATGWSTASASPQVVTTMGALDIGYMQMWGNKVVGESIQQVLGGAGFVAGKSYRLKAWVRWPNNNPNLPQYVKFRFRASAGAATYGVAAANTSEIGVTGVITSTAWTQVTLPLWTAPFACNTLTINPENEFSIDDGAYVSWGQIDDICIQEAFRWTVIGNGTLGTLGGPKLEGEGTLLAGEPATVDLTDALPGSVAYYLVGLQHLGLPFYGGTLIPSPDVVLPFGVDANGAVHFGFDAPALPPGLPIYFQALVLDPGAQGGVALSNGLTVTTP